MKTFLTAGVAALALAATTSPLFAAEAKVVKTDAANTAEAAKKLTEEELNTLAPAAGEATEATEQAAEKAADEAKDAAKKAQ